jgi:glycosyltransferase involved in cell wall biosynthesis
MKLYDKRIGFLVSYQALTPYGGIGQFTRSFIKLMEQNNVKVDIITDKKPQDSEFIKSINATIIYPQESHGYTDHSAIFMYGDSYCYERMANFRNAIIHALSKNLYDTFVCNTYESVQIASTMGLEDVIQIIAYTHLESQIFPNTLHNPFLDSVNEMMRKQLDMDALYIGTQSRFNQAEIDNGAWHLPIPITESELLKEHHKPREGVLFVGRWEEGKNPELYLKLIEETKLPARVMTNANGAKKFEARLKELGADYKIAINVIGQEKVDFITGCRVALNPSTVESYGMAFYEQLIQLPTFCLENQRWTNNFEDYCFFKTNKKTMSKDVLEVYNRFVNASDWYGNGNGLLKFQKEEADVFSKWNECFNAFTAKQSNSNTAKILTYETTTYSDFIKDLNRSIICIDDIRSVLTNRHKFNIVYTDKNTYLSKDDNFVPEEQLTGFSLFEEIL